MDEQQEDPRFSAPPPDQQEPEDLELEGYVLQREISRGGQAIIFSAIMKSTGRKVAVKFFPGGSFATRKEKVRMDREVRVLAALDHPNIVSVIDRGQTADGSTYFVLEYVRGKTLAEYIDDFWDQQGPPKTTADIKQLLQLFVRICDAINAAHLRGVVHRDLKPSNIVIDSYGEPHILDFGVALSSVPLLDDAGEPLPSVTWTGEFLGSVQWASPEQAEGDQTKIDVRSDVYSLGIILYEALTGDFPYDVFGSLPNTLKHIISAPARLPSEAFIERMTSADVSEKEAAEQCLIDSELDQIVLRALEKDRANRYQTAGEFAKALSGYLAGHTVSIKRPLIRRRGWRTTAAALGGAAALAVAVFIGTRWHLERSAAPPMMPDERVRSTDQFRAMNVFGYRIVQDDIIFEFDARDFDLARLANGALGQVADIPTIHRVAIAGPFNAWDPRDPDWIMQRVRNRFELRKPLTDFAGRYEWPFKFVINDLIWVSAPAMADNKEVVVEDTATYNLLLINPQEVEDPTAQTVRQYRETLNQAWPRSGENLVRDENDALHLTLTGIEVGTRMQSLKPINGIPLTSLHLADLRVSDLEVLAGMDTLRWLVISDHAYNALLFDMLRLANQEDYPGALRAMHAALATYAGVPAFERTRNLLQTSLQGLEALRQAPQQIPETARQFDDRHYLWVVRPMNWVDARAFAESFGATLAAVRSPEQQHWLTEQFGWPTLGRNTWLGGTDEQVRGSWGWLSGDAWTYEYWAAGYPDRDDEQARAAAMNYDGWWVNLNTETRLLPFLIEWRTD